MQGLPTKQKQNVKSDKLLESKLGSAEILHVWLHTKEHFISNGSMRRNLRHELGRHCVVLTRLGSQKGAFPIQTNRRMAGLKGKKERGGTTRNSVAH